jgi:hypothetical protein
VRTAPVLVLVVATALLSESVARAEPVYFGAAARGGLSPDVVVAFRGSLERAMAKHGIKVLDASSVAEDTAKKSLADAKAALDEGLTAFNDDDYKTALDGAAGALKLFEDGPAFTDDDQALKALIVVLPRYAPSREKAPPELVRHVDDVKDELRSLPPTTIEVKSKPAGARVTVDGKVRGRSPLLVDDIVPGVHYVTVEAGGGRYTERLVVGDEGAHVDARLGSKKGAAAHDVIMALSRPTSAKIFVQNITEVDDDVLVAVLLPAGKKIEVIAGRVVGGEVRVVCGTRLVNTDNAREKATYDLAEAILSKRDDEWVSVKDDVADLRPKLFSSLGSTAVPDVDPDEPAAPTSPLVWIGGIAGLTVGVAAVALGVGIYVQRELRKDQGFTFDVDTKNFTPGGAGQ